MEGPVWPYWLRSFVFEIEIRVSYNIIDYCFVFFSHDNDRDNWCVHKVRSTRPVGRFCMVETEPISVRLVCDKRWWTICVAYFTRRGLDSDENNSDSFRHTTKARLLFEFYTIIKRHTMTSTTVGIWCIERTISVSTSNDPGYFGRGKRENSTGRPCPVSRNVTRRTR